MRPRRSNLEKAVDPSTSRVVWDCSLNWVVDLCGETDSEQVQRWKGEKNFEKKVKSA